MTNRIANETGPLTDLVRVIVKYYLMNTCLIIGTTGNLLTLVILTKKRMRTHRTNIYLIFITLFDSLYLLSAYIINLAYNSPQVVNYNLYQISLYFIYPLVDFSSNTSIYVILVFTLERYAWVKYPFGTRGCFMFTNSKIKCLAVILFSLLLTFPTILENRLVERHNLNNSTLTNTTRILLIKSDFYTREYTFVYFLISAIVFHLIPFILLILLNAILIKYCFLTPEQLIKDSLKHFVHGTHIEMGSHSCSKTSSRRVSVGLRLNGNTALTVRRANEKKRLIVLLVVINLVLILCHVPSSLVMIRESFRPIETLKDKSQRDVVLLFNNIANGLLAINASLNFFLYCGFSKKFRASFVDLFRIRLKMDLS